MYDLMMLIDKCVFSMRLNIGNIDLSDEDIALMKVSAALKGWSMRQYVANALNGFLQVKKNEILNTVKLRAKKYGISEEEAFRRLFSDEGFDGLTIVDPAPLLTSEEKEQSVKMFSLTNFDLHPEGK
ncbi:MAG: hypothetical protein HC895_01400 [Leptolyngbyaceae cyanobacterium SM1_3_5]|nr:hypothetical protein [Leptolyngbyaceae cyanobacterium SM1_3_5]